MTTVEEFYYELEKRAPRYGAKLNWQEILGPDYRKAFYACYKANKRKGRLPSVNDILCLHRIFSVEELEKFCLHKLNMGNTYASQIMAYEEFFEKKFVRKTKTNRRNLTEERELEAKRKRSRLEREVRRRTLMEKVWRMEQEGLIGLNEHGRGNYDKD